MSYLGNGPSPVYSINRVINKYSYIATESQTIFDAVYDDVVDVYLNGMKLQDGVDYTATDGVTVVLTVAATEDDVVDIAGYFNIENFDINDYSSSFLVDFDVIQNKPDPNITVTLTGDVTGSANTTLVDLANGSISIVSTVGNATTATSLAGGLASQVPYQSASGVTAFVANGTSGQVLISNGTSAPTWGNVDGDVTLTGVQTLTNKTLGVSSYTQIADASLGTGTHTFDYSAGDMQQLTATGDITIAFSNFVTGEVCTMIIDAVNWGDYTITHPAAMLFAAGTAPTYTVGGTDRLMIVKDKDDIYSLFIIGQAVGVVA